jgi:hypothetical protein
MAMRALLTLSSFVVVFGLAGCGETVTTRDTETGRKLSLTVPNDVSLEQGESETFKVSINRDNFNEAVTVEFENLPAGVKVVEEARTIPAGSKAVEFTLQAERDAQPVNNHPVRVKASGGGLNTESAQFMLEIEKKD